MRAVVALTPATHRALWFGVFRLLQGLGMDVRTAASPCDLATGGSDVVLAVIGDGAIDPELVPSGSSIWRCEVDDTDIRAERADFIVPTASLGHAESVDAVCRRALGPVLGEGVDPDRFEHAMLMASTSSWRAVGLTGRVGCAILDPVGDVIALGANEVPSAGGGQYWVDSVDDARQRPGDDDPARSAKRELVAAVLDYAHYHGADIDDVDCLADGFLGFLDGELGQPGLPQTHAAVRSLESLGRVVHAELAALVVASRHTASCVGADVVVTQPPCRQCLRQLIVSGVRSVRYLGEGALGAYLFHADAISASSDNGLRVQVIPHTGFTPRGIRRVMATIDNVSP